MTAQCVLIVDDDQLLVEALSMLLERNGRTIVVCHDIEAAEMALSRFAVTHIVADVQFSGSFGFEGFHFLGRLANARRNVTTVLMTGQPSDSLRAAALAMGAASVLEKPFAVSELEAFLGEPQDDRTPARTIVVPTVSDVIRSGWLASAYQPIVRLGETHLPFGFEALLRSRRRFPLGRAVTLLDYASRCQQLGDLNRAAAHTAIVDAAPLPSDALLFLNVDPVALDRSFARRTKQAAGISDLSLDRLVLEITERSDFPDLREALYTIDSLRELGVRFALDDHGSAYSHLALISRIRPSFIKISGTFGIGVEHDTSRQHVVRHAAGLARDFGALSILEGIESESAAQLARELSVDCAQGFHFGRPRSSRHWAAVGPYAIGPQAAEQPFRRTA